MYVLYNEVRGWRLNAAEEEIGSLADLYVDDRDWRVSYLVVETGGWFSSNKVLVRTSELTGFDISNRHLETSLTKDKIERAPPASTVETVSGSRDTLWRVEPSEHVFFAGPRGAVLPPSLYGDAFVMDRDTDEAIPQDEEEQPHLRSVNELLGYSVAASDEAVGTVADLVVEADKWAVTYLSVDTGNWLPGKLVVVSPEWARNISWSRRSFDLEMTAKQIEESPSLSSIEGLERSYEEALYGHYGYPIM